MVGLVETHLGLALRKVFNSQRSVGRWPRSRSKGGATGTGVGRSVGCGACSFPGIGFESGLDFERVARLEGIGPGRVFADAEDVLVNLGHEADLGEGMGGLGDELRVGGLGGGEGADFGTELGFGLEFAEFAHGLVHGVFRLSGVAVDAVETVVEVGVDEGVGGGAGDVFQDVEFGFAAAFEVPGAFDDAFVDDVFEGSGGFEFGAEAGFEFGEGVLLAGEDDEVFGREVMFGRVLGGGGFAGFGFWAG